MFGRHRSRHAPGVTPSILDGSFSLATVNNSGLESLPKPVLFVTLCRFREGKLERTSRCVETTKYLVISHVWGETEWRKISVIPEDVLVSKEKAKFIEERLNAAVGQEYF